MLNDVWRREEREGKWAVSLQTASTQGPRNFVRETDGPCINHEGLNHYTSVDSQFWQFRGRPV